MLSKRLLTAVGMITKGNIVADVGCDHAYTSIYLRKENIAPKVIAMDVNKGPLARAKEHIEEAGLIDSISLRLSDGLEKLSEHEVDTVLLCGMGGLLMIKILSDYPEIIKTVKELVLQPQSEVAQVRHFLHKEGYEIEKEHILKEDGKFYVVMRAVPKAQVQLYEEECHYLYGKLLIEEKSEILKEFLQREYNLKMKVWESLQEKETENALARKKALQEEFEHIRKTMEWISYCSHSS